MSDPHAEAANPVLAEIWRGEILESVHRGTAVICRADGELIAAWGDPARVILPRSACKMLQALPLVESGAADAAGLGAEQLALACASHQGTALHTSLVAAWLEAIGRDERDLRCGTHPPYDKPTRIALRQAGEPPCQLHNNCSGKHSGFLTLTRRLGGSSEYVELDHPVQKAVRRAIEETTDQTAAGWAIDVCSAPNFAVSISGLATAMARFATPETAFTGARRGAAQRLGAAMMAHPHLVSGQDHPTATMTRACHGRAVLKSGAEGVYAAILPDAGLGVALKIDDGDSDNRGRNAAIAALLTRTGALDRGDPIFARFADAPLFNARGIAHGRLRAAETLLS